MQREEIYTWNAKCLYVKAICNTGVSNLAFHGSYSYATPCAPLILLEEVIILS